MAPQNKQKPVTTPEVRDALLDLIQRKFYEGHAVQFAKDRRRLIQWVVCYPAAWLYGRGVSSGLPLDRYKEIMSRVLIEAASFVEPTKVTYLPAYLRQVIRSHFRHHGDEIYEEAKSVRNLVDQAMLLSGSVRVAADPVRELAQAAAASRLLKPRKRAVKAPTNGQLDLL